jgi:hypothetical protein
MNRIVDAYPSVITMMPDDELGCRNHLLHLIGCSGWIFISIVIDELNQAITNRIRAHSDQSMMLSFNAISEYTSHDL